MAARTAADGMGARGWLEMGGEKKTDRKWVGRRRRWRSASLPGPARTTADGVGAREWLDMCWEKKPLGMSELGCADGAHWAQKVSG